MTLLAGLLWVAPAALVLFALLVTLNYSRSALGENILQRVLIVLCLALVAAHLVIGTQTAPAPQEPLSFILVEEMLLHTEPERVRGEVRKASHTSTTRVASFRRPGVRAEKETVPAQIAGFPSAHRFSSPVAAMGWAGLEAGGREGASVTIISERGTGLQPPPDMALYQVAMPPGPQSVQIESISVPPLVFEGRRGTIRIKIRSALEEDYSIRLFDGENLLEERPTGSGQSPADGIEMNLEQMKNGTHILRVEIRDKEGTTVDQKYARLNVREPPRIDYFVGPDSGSPLPTFLEEAGYQVSTFSADDISGSIDDERGEVAIFDNVPVSKLSWPVVGRLYRSVSKRGGGVLVVGGDRSFGPGGYTGSAIERLMPVWMGLKNKDEENHTTAFLVIIDTSTSMLCPPEGCPTDAERMWGSGRAPRGPRVRKIDLARQSLLNLLPAMKEMDYFGILGGRISPYWEVEPGSMESLEELGARIMAIDGGGTGIYLYSSLLEARKIMGNLDAEMKHIVAMIDTDDVHERRIMGLGNLDELVRLLRDDNISLSFIGLGFSDDQYVPLLSRLASRTGGYLYLTSDVGEVPTFLLDDRERLARHQVIRKHLLTHFSLKDFPALKSTPPLEGQFITETKSDARTLIWSELGYPVFALRNLGRGTVASLSTDGGESLAPAWVAGDSGPLWDSLLSKLLDDSSDGGEIFLSRKGAALAAYFAPGEEGAFREVRARIISPPRIAAEGPMTEVFPGVYRASLGELPAGGYRISVDGGDGNGKLIETVFTVPEVEAAVSNPPPRPDAPPSRKEHSPPVEERWLRALLILAAAFSTLYEIVRQR